MRETPTDLPMLEAVGFMLAEKDAEGGRAMAGMILINKDNQAILIGKDIIQMGTRIDMMRFAQKTMNNGTKPNESPEKGDIHP